MVRPVSISLRKLIKNFHKTNNHLNKKFDALEIQIPCTKEYSWQHENIYNSSLMLDELSILSLKVRSFNNSNRTQPEMQPMEDASIKILLIMPSTSYIKSHELESTTFKS